MTAPQETLELLDGLAGQSLGAARGYAAFYEDEWTTLYCADAADVLPSVTADVLVTDPPYGVEYRSNKRNQRFDAIANDKAVDAGGVLAVLETAIRQLRRGRHAYIFGKLEIGNLPLCGVTELIWDKGIIGMGDLQSPWGTEHEPITFGVYELSAANRAKGYGNLSARMRKGSVLRVQRTQGGAVTKHPTEKPVMLLRQLIESSSVMGETVLDPFCGVGSTLVAARLEGRKSIGIEINHEYCTIAAQRLSKLRGRDDAA